jgi:hypothetical protein
MRTLRPRRALDISVAAILVWTFLGLGSRIASGVVLFEEDFEGLNLGPVVTFPSEIEAREAWTSTAPANWVSDPSGVPGDPVNEGVQEFRGWTFVDKAWWIATAGDQDRTDFVHGYGTLAVADPDEFDDFSLGSGEGRGPAPDGCDPLVGGCFSCGLTTPAISLQGAAANSVRVVFDSSWRPEDTQKGIIEVSFDGGAFTPLRGYASVNSDGSTGTANGTGTFTKITGPTGAQIGDILPDLSFVNEVVDVAAGNPAGATSMTLRFRMIDAGNDWWWAVDNLQVYTGTPGPRDPVLKVVVDRDTGNVSVINGTSQSIQLRGYEIRSADGSFDVTSAAFLADSNSNWRQLTGAAAGTDLSEGYLQSAGTPLASGASFSLGNGAWKPFHVEQDDITFQYLVPGQDDPVRGLVEFVGNDGQSFAFLDLNFDGFVNINDWQTFLDVTTTADLSSLTPAQAYRQGDLDGDLRLGVNDFIVFQREFDRINGAGSFAAALASVPEPASIVILLGGAAVTLSTQGCRRRCGRRRRLE